MKSWETTETNHDAQATKPRRLGIAVVLAFFAAHPSLPEEHIGSCLVRPLFGTDTHNNASSPELFPKQVVIEPNNAEKTITSRSYYTDKNGNSIEFATTTISTAQKKKKASTPTTDVGYLATCFQQVLVAATSNTKNEKSIHVGKLLSASLQLEETMRKIGFIPSANDIQGNVDKIRKLYNLVPERDSMAALLRYEIIESGILENNKGVRKIPENSATNGFLWLGRSLNYQYDMFSYMLDNPNCEPYEAARHAYDRDLKPHLSWPLQKVSETAMISFLKHLRQKDILAPIGGFSKEYYDKQDDQATRRDLRQLMTHLKLLLSEWRKDFSDLDLENI